MQTEEVEKLIDKKLSTATVTRKRRQAISTVADTQSLVINKKRHVNERRMAWTSLIAMLVIALVMIFRVPPEHVAQYDTLITTLYFALSGVVLGYMGFTTWGANKTFENSRKLQEHEQDIEDGTTTDQSVG